MSAPLSPKQVAAIRDRHAAAELGALYPAPEPFAAPGTIRATIGGVPLTVAVMDFRGWKADENKQFVLRAHDDVRQLLEDRARFADRADMAARIGELELAVGSAVLMLHSISVRVHAGQVPDLEELEGWAEELRQVQRSGVEAAKSTLAAEIERLRARVDEMLHAAMGDRTVRLFDEVGEVRNARTIADAQLARANTLDRLCREKSARVAELEAERHSTNEALSDAAEALRDASTAAGLITEYVVPLADRAWLAVRREHDGDRWSIRRHRYRIHVWTGEAWVTPDEALEKGTLWSFGSADAALAEATRLAEAGERA